MNELQRLYQTWILEHARRPRNFAVLEPATGSARRSNALCGDDVSVYWRGSGERIEQLAFSGTGCAISVASASVMTLVLTGHDVVRARALLAAYCAFVGGEVEPLQAALAAKAEIPAELCEQLTAFAAVAQFPARVTCARLAWLALAEALSNESAG